MTGLDRALAEQFFVKVHHLRRLQRQRCGSGQTVEQTRGMLRADRIHRRMYLAACRYAHHRQAFVLLTFTQRIEHVTRGTITTGEHQQLDTSVTQRVHRRSGVFRTGAPCRRLIHHLWPHPELAQHRLTHVATGADEAHRVSMLRNLAQRHCSTLLRQRLCAPRQRLLDNGFAVTALERNAAADAGQRVDKHTDFHHTFARKKLPL